MVSGIIVAAGSGSRMGVSVNKVFLDLAGRPVLFYSLAALAKEMDEVILVLREEDFTSYEKLLARDFPQVRLVQGGASRPQSVERGLAALDPRSRYVLIHDGARPFLKAPLIRAVLKGAKEAGAAVPAVEVKDTLVQWDGQGRMTGRLDRAGFRAVQTPQAFSVPILKELLRESVHNYTDESAVFYEAGRSVRLVEGDHGNFKITRQEDLLLARALLAQGGVAEL